MSNTDKRSLLNYEILISFGLTLILWNTGRVLPYLGIGELLLFCALYLGLILFILNHKNIFLDDIGKRYSFIALAYFGLAIPIITLINFC